MGAKLRCALHQLSTDPLISSSQHAFDAYGDFERRLSTEQRLPIVQAAEDVVYPATSFHDPGQHLTEKAAVDRTLRLLDALGVSR